MGGCFFIVILDNWTALGINQSGVPNDDMAYVTVMSEREAMMRLVCTHYVHVQKCCVAGKELVFSMILWNIVWDH